MIFSTPMMSQKYPRRMFEVFGNGILIFPNTETLVIRVLYTKNRGGY